VADALGSAGHAIIRRDAKSGHDTTKGYETGSDAKSGYNL
jgi:hypothetical protein